MKIISTTKELECEDFGIIGELILKNVENFELSGHTISNLFKRTKSIDYYKSLLNLTGTYLTGTVIDFSRPITLSIAKKAIYNADVADNDLGIILDTLLGIFLKDSGVGYQYTLYRKARKTVGMVKVSQLVTHK